ncbi:MAG: DUF6125 family protein [Promethearchaeota archaeon]
MRKITEKDKLFYFERNFFTLDGLWMIETEKETNWDTALKIDLAVWKSLLKIIIRRIKRYLHIETNMLKDLIDVLTFRWAVEGWNYEIKENSDNKAVILIKKCPYKEIMERNPERRDKIPLICKDMCIPFYEAVVKDFNPQIRLDRTEFLGLGGILCNFKFHYIGDKSERK